MTRGVVITGWGTCVPDRIVTNDDLQEQGLDTTDAWIRERTGIEARRWASSGETTSSLAILAGAEAIKDAGLAPGDVDLVIVATSTPDQPMPATASFVSDGLGLSCGSFDVNAACAGYAYAMVVAAGMVASGTADTILVIGSETMSRVLDVTDRGTAIIFGDGAGAAVMRASMADGPEAPGLLAWDNGSDPSSTRLIEIPQGGNIRMQGNEVFRRAVRAVVDSVTSVLNRAGKTAADVDLFVPHQANSRIVDAVCQRLDIPIERALVNIGRYGNTSTASIPLALVDAIRGGRLNDGDLVLISGFGAGMTWASALMRWGST